MPRPSNMNYEIISPEFRKEVRNLAKELGKEAKERGIQHAALARLLGCSTQAVQQILSGRHPVSAYKISVLAKMLGYRVRLTIVGK